MKTAGKIILLTLVVLLPHIAVVIAAPSAATLVGASKFSSVEYFATPHQQQMRTRVSGAEATPLPDGLIRITQLQIERFREDGKLEVVINAPDCVYDTMQGTASSPGLVKMQTGDGNFRETGDGFLWRRSESSLTISNNVRTVIETPSGKISVP